MLAVGLLARTLVCFVIVPAWEAGSNIAPASDAYPVLARNLLEHGTLGFDPFGASPTTTRGPAFAAWLAPALAVGGDDPRWLALWGSLAGVGAAAWLVVEVARRRGERAGVIAGLVLVLHPLPAWIAGRCMSDDFYGALGFGAAAALCRGIEGHRAGTASPRRGWWLGAATALLAAQLLTRSAGLLTAGALLVTLVLVRPEARGAAVWRRGRLATALVIALALVPALAWSVRTSVHEGRPVFVQSLTGYNFWLGEGFERFGAEDAKGEFARARTELVFATAGEPLPPPRFWWGELTPEQLSRMEPRLVAAAWQRIAADPLSYAGRVARGLWHFWFRAETASRSRQYVLVALPLVALAGFGAWRALRRRADPLAVALALAVVLHMLAYAAVVPQARYSVGVYPAIVFLSALAFGATATRIQNR